MYSHFIWARCGWWTQSLLQMARPCVRVHASAHLGGFLQMASVVLLDVVPGADGGFQLVSHHHARALGGRPSDEQHHAGPCVGECTLRRKRGGNWLQLGIFVYPLLRSHASYLTISCSYHTYKYIVCNNSFYSEFWISNLPIFLFFSCWELLRVPSSQICHLKKGLLISQKIIYHKLFW